MRGGHGEEKRREEKRREEKRREEKRREEKMNYRGSRGQPRKRRRLADGESG
jgi:hypothetical protein